MQQLPLITMDMATIEQALVDKFCPNAVDDDLYYVEWHYRVEDGYDTVWAATIHQVIEPVDAIRAIVREELDKREARR